MDKRSTTRQLLFILLLLNIHTLHGQRSAENRVNFVNSKENQAEDYSTRDPIKRKFHREDHDLRDPEGPSDHTIPYSEHEVPRDVPTRPKYLAPGLWAKPKKDVPLDFVPTKLYAQVRGTHTVKRLPKSEAIKSAETEDEKENAPRLREVVTNSKVNTIYTEEGYEDSAYDHAGQIRDADFEEDFAKKRRDKLKAERGSGVGEFRKEGKKAELREDDDYADYSDRLDADGKLVTLNGINRLEEDLRREDEEAEKYTDNYEALNIRNSYERNDYDDNGSKSAESDNKSDYGDTKESQVFGMKKKVRRGRPRNLQGRENVYADNYEVTEKYVNPEIDSTTVGYQGSQPLVDLSGLPAQAIDQTALNYMTPPASEYVDNEQTGRALPTTVNYGQLVWDYFKTKQDQQLNSQPYVERLEGTTMTGEVEQKNAAAVTTIHGPYRLAQQEITTASPAFLPQIYHPEIESQSLGQGENLGYFNTIDSLSPYVTLQPFSADGQSWTPLEVQEAADLVPGFSLPANNYHNILSSSSAGISVSPSEIVPPQTESESNPFLTPLLRNAYASSQNKPRYKVLVRHKPKKSSKTGDATKISGHEARQNSSDDFSRSKRVNDFPSRDGESSLEGFTVMRPPPLPQMRDAYSTSPTDHSSANPIVIGQQSVSPEKGFPQEGNWKSPRSLYRAAHNSVAVAVAVAADPTLLQSAGLNLSARKRNASPATMLLPPSPQVNDEYAKYRVNGKGAAYSRNIDRLVRYAPIIFELDRKARGLRRKRSLGADREIDEGDVKGATALRTSFGNNGEDIDKNAGGERAARSRRVRKEYSGGTSNSMAKQGEVVKPRNYAAGEGLESLSKPRIAADGESDVRRLGKKDGSKEIEARLTNNMNAIKTAIKGENAGRKSKRNTARGGVSLESRPNSGTRRKSREKTFSHDELLNRSPKIAEDVVEREIETRFGKNGNNIDGSNEVIEEGQKVEVEVPDFDYVEESSEKDVENLYTSTTTKASVDARKYPFYNDDAVPKSSPLKYITDPNKVPRKTGGGLEFYESRDAYKQCDEVEPSLDEVLPDEEEPVASRGPKENLPRLRGLGDKLDCLRAKYFDDDPFDNPFFSEKISKMITPAPEINPEKFLLRILRLPSEDHGQILQRLSKKPERKGSRKRKVSTSGRAPDFYRTIRIDNKNTPQVGRIYLHTVRQSASNSPSRSSRSHRQKLKMPTFEPTANTPYHRQVYEDVMGNIRSLANSYDHDLTTVIPMNHAPSATNNEHLDTLNVSAFSREKITLVPLIDFTGNRTNGKASIKGLVPPPFPTESSRPSYRKIRQLSKSRSQPSRSRYIGKVQKIRIYKRSVASDLVSDNSRISREVKDLTTILEPEHDLNESTHLDDLKRGEMPGKIYTIRDRIRYSKPKENERNFGKFVKDSHTSDVDIRRKEPRYNLIRRTKARQNATSPSLHLNESASSTVQNVPQRSQTINKSRLAQIEQVPDTLRLPSESSASADRQSQTTTQDTNTYAVHESLEEGTKTTPLSAAFEDSEKHSAPISNESESTESAAHDSTESTRSDKLKVIEEDTKADDDRSESIEYSNESNEETPAKLEEDFLSKESESSPESGSDESGKTFFHYKSSPNLRENKNTKKSRFGPSSSFFKSLHSGSSEDASESEEDKQKKKYVFPWDHVKDDDDGEEGRSGHYSTSIDYEYPWERRERLKRRKQSKRDGFKSFFKDDDDDDARSKRRSYVYPWDRYEVPSKDHVNSGTRLRHKSIFDNAETSSENRPVTRFSSRYNLSKIKSNEDFSPLADNETETVGSIDSSTRTFTAPNYIGLFNSTTENPSSSTFASHRRIFGGMIVPEDITPAPRRKNGKNRTLFNEKSKLVNLPKPSDKILLNESLDIIKETQQKPIVIAYGTTIDPEKQTEDVTTPVPEISSTTVSNQNTHRRRKMAKNSTVNPTVTSNTESTSESVNSSKSRGRSRFSTTTMTPEKASFTTTAASRVIRRRPKPSTWDKNQSSDIKPLPKSSAKEVPPRKNSERRSRISTEHIIAKSSHPREEIVIENSTVPDRSIVPLDSHERRIEGGKNQERLVKYENPRAKSAIAEIPDYSDVIRKINEGAVTEYKNGWSSFETTKDDGSLISKEIDPFDSVIQNDDDESLKSDLPPDSRIKKRDGSEHHERSKRE